MSKDKPAASVVYVTPEIASRWLGKNRKNRNIRSVVVDAYARDMLADNWQFTGEAIKFDRTGNLSDGQHRLMAIVRSGVTLPFLIVRNLDPSAQNVMDTGAKRTSADALSLSGFKHGTALSAGARTFLLMEQGLSNGSVTNSEIAECVTANPDLTAAAEACAHLRGNIDLTPAVITYTWLILSRVDREACAQFFESLANNSTNGKGDPRSTLLKRLANARRSGERLSRTTQIHFVIRTWNAWRKGRELRVLKLAPTLGKTDVPKAV